MHKTYQRSTVSVIIFLMVCSANSCSEAQYVEPITPGAYRIAEIIDLLGDNRIGVVVNQTSKIGGVHLVDTLLSLGAGIHKIFTPEHGFKGNADAGALVADGFYTQAKIPIISLYGSKRKPTAEDLQDVDILLFDLQDVGVRYYTYIGSMHYIMEACAEQNIPLIILDRPNPNGHYIDGPVLRKEYRSFVGMHAVPLVHGMTIGEFAGMINGEGWLSDSLSCNLTVVKCLNYSHTDQYRLPVPPSPNLQSMAAIYLYPSTGLFEGTIVSEGRGTPAPFQLIGHPEYPDRSVSFVPMPVKGASMNPKLKGDTCYGIDLRSVPIDSLQARREIQLDYIIQFFTRMEKGEDFFIDYFDLLAGTSELKKQILIGKSQQEIRMSWQENITDFKKIRVKYLLYPDFE